MPFIAALHELRLFFSFVRCLITVLLGIFPNELFIDEQFYHLGSHVFVYISDKSNDSFSFNLSELQEIFVRSQSEFFDVSQLGNENRSSTFQDIYLFHTY